MTCCWPAAPSPPTGKTWRGPSAPTATTRCARAGVAAREKATTHRDTGRMLRSRGLDECCRITVVAKRRSWIARHPQVQRFRLAVREAHSHAVFYDFLEKVRIGEVLVVGGHQRDDGIIAGGKAGDTELSE